MRESEKQELKRRWRQLQQQVEQMGMMIDSLVPEKEWYTAGEFAKKKGLSKKTVWNYLSAGKFDQTRQNGDGKTEIHKSEL